METDDREPITPRFKKNQLIINALLLVCHITFFVMFFCAHIYLMAIVNVGSILCYLCNFFFIEKNRYIIVCRLSYYEILIHLILAIISVGNNSGFIMIGTILPFYLFFTMRSVLLEPHTKNIEQPFTYLVTAGIGMIVATIWSLKHGSLYRIDDSTRLMFQITIIVFIMGAFSGVMSYFLKQMQHIQFNLIAQKNKFVKMSKYDGLTGLYNRRCIQDYMERAFLKKMNFSVILCDIDDFKHINDTYGHICGDQVLVHISDILRASVAMQDMVGRWGGEEILIMLPDCSLQRAQEIAEVLRRNVEQENFLYEGKELQLTMTLGVVETKNEETLHEIIKKVDDYLYKGKEAGKNCVVME